MLMSDITTSSESAGALVGVSDGVATIEPGTASNPYAYFAMSGLTPGESLTFSCRLEYLGDWDDDEYAIIFYTSKWNTFTGNWDKRDGNEVRRQFTVPSDGYIYIRFRARHDGLRVSRISIESTHTFDASLPFFYYGTMPRE